MIKSMTGYGTARCEKGGVTHVVEVKSVNSKFCDIKTRLPFGYSGLEIEVIQHLKSRIPRGRIDVVITRENSPDGPKDVSVNLPLAEAFVKEMNKLRQHLNINQDVNLSMILGAREIVSFNRKEEDIEALWAVIKPALDEALDNLIEMREREGKALALDLAGRCNSLKEMVQDVSGQAPKVVEHYREKILERIAELKLGELDESRLAQEVCLYADRVDITEEITRLRSHFQQFLRLLDSEEPQGRKLDFLLQEMNRETNTIGSKCNNGEISLVVVDMKSGLEKLREQVQNVE